MKETHQSNEDLDELNIINENTSEKSQLNNDSTLKHHKNNNNEQTKQKMKKSFHKIYIIIIILLFLFSINFFTNTIKGKEEKNLNNTNESMNNNKFKDLILENVSYDDNIPEQFLYILNQTINVTIRNEQDFINYCNGKTEKQMADLYLQMCNKGFLFDKVIFKRVEKPKISIILLVYNRQGYILRILRSIQNQPMKDIEIIFVDDCSSDKSVKLIEYYQQFDKRIILIKHERNKGTLASRVEGIYEAEGEYIMFVDSDDLILYNILDKTYEAAQKGNYEVVQFAVFRRNFKGNYWNYGAIRKTTPIYQPELSYLMYYYRGYLRQTDWHVWGKLIKRDVLYKTLDSIDDYYLKSNMSVNEDGVIDFMLLKIAKSFIYMKTYGYIYTLNYKSLVWTVYRRADSTIRDYILYIKFLFENTGDNWKEKSMAGEQLRYVYNTFYNTFKYVTKNFKLIYETLDLFINCKYIVKRNKNRARTIKGIVLEAEKKFNKKTKAEKKFNNKTKTEKKFNNKTKSEKKK